MQQFLRLKINHKCRTTRREIVFSMLRFLTDRRDYCTVFVWYY